MSTLSRLAAALVTTSMLMAAGCGGLKSSPSKVVMSEAVCSNVHFLNMKFNKTNRVILDNRKYTEGQTGMGVTLFRFPVTVQGAVPEGSTIGDRVSTIVLKAKPGDQSQVDLVPTFTGTFKATCTTAVLQGGAVVTKQQDIDFQIK